MQTPPTPIKKLKSHADVDRNLKTSITCTNVPEGLFDQEASKRHFSKFGQPQKIRLFPKKQMCIVEYDQLEAVERALLNAGAFDGFMFDVTRTKQRIRKRSKREEDPDWVPDADVQAELSALGRTPVYRMSRQKPMDVEVEKITPKSVAKQSAIRKQVARDRPVKTIMQVPTLIEPPVVPVLQTTLNNMEAAAELHQLRSRVSLTPDEQWRTLDARDRILRAWGGAGSRLKVGGATIGTCPDMCPEKELLHRQAEHQVMTLETYPDSDGQLDPSRAVKQYSRSSADQEIPMCYELRPAKVLMRTCAYLLQEVADTNRQVSLSDWFHFMWDRLRSIRKDITQQALCCSESIQLVEMCARFHAHCSARLADLEHTQFDQKLNTDNLTKCLQTLKYMYADVGREQKPREAEFRGYIALLNLGDSNFWWEIKQLPVEIQKSEHIMFAIKIFNALDNNNYVRFFRLIQQKASYLQACILLRYFNDVRARALARIMKAYAPRGGSRYPVEELMSSLAFESVESMISFITHYGLRLSKSEDSELAVILDRNQFIEDSDPYPISRAVHLIESKRNDTVGKVIAGGQLPTYDFSQYQLYSSFTQEGKLKECALVAEDLGYDTANDSNKVVKELKNAISRLNQGETNSININASVKNTELQSKTDVKVSYGKSRNPFINPASDTINKFPFSPAIPVAAFEVIKKTPEKEVAIENKKKFSFSKPQESPEHDKQNIFKISSTVADPPKVLFEAKKHEMKTSIFGAKLEETPKAVFGKITNNNIFGRKDDESQETNIFSKTTGTSIFTKSENKQPGTSNIFGQVKPRESNTNVTPSIFVQKFDLPAGNFVKKTEIVSQNKFLLPTQNGEDAKSCTSPGTLFKSAIAPLQNSGNKTTFSIFQTKNNIPSVADNIRNSVPPVAVSIYDFDQIEDQSKMQRMIEEKTRKEAEQAELQTKIKLEEERKLELMRREDEQRKEQERKKQEELKRLEEKRKKEEEEKRQQEIQRKIEEQRKAELKKKAEEEEKIFKKRVEKESNELIEEIFHEITHEDVKDLMKTEMEWFKNLILNVENTTNEILKEVCDEIATAEIKAEKFWTEKVSKKWFSVWKKQLLRNKSRRSLLDGTPVWLTDKTPFEEASCLKRLVERSALTNMNNFHRGYRFSGEPKYLRAPEPYNLLEIIRSSLLKRLKRLNYPYDKCFFWKITIVCPDAMKWLYRKIEMVQWIMNAFSDNSQHQTSNTLIRSGLQSWNNLMNFAISVSLINHKCESEYGEALEGSNGLLFYTTESYHSLLNNIQKTLDHKYPYQRVPIAVILTETVDQAFISKLEMYLTEKVQHNDISAYKIYIIKKDTLPASLNTVTKSALKWIAKKYPPLPPLEIDYLKSLCQRYLANEFWCRLRTERDTRMHYVVKDMPKLIKCYNTAVDKLTEVLTNEDLFNYPSFPLEFNVFLNSDSPYPKPFEFIPSNVKNSENACAVKNVMEQLKLPESKCEFHPLSATHMQDQIRNYCSQIGWFDNAEDVACKVIAVLPNELTDDSITSKDFCQQFEHYDLIDFLNVIVYEKISKIKCFDNLFAIYDKSSMEMFRNMDWIYNVDVVFRLKHKPLEYEDDLDLLMDAKRRKIISESMECLMLEDKDSTLVDENVEAINENVVRYSNCKDVVKQLEKQLEAEKIKSLELDMLLQSALSDM